MMLVRRVLFLLCIGPWCGMYGQEFTFSMAARCSIPLNDPARQSYHLDLGYADTSWTIDWLRINYASAYLFKIIDVFTVNERTRSAGLACGWYLHRGKRLEMRAGIQLRYDQIERSVFTGPIGWASGAYSAGCVGYEVPVQVALRLGRSGPFQLFVETVPGYTGVISQRGYDRPDPSMRIRNTLNLAMLAGISVRM